MKRLKQLLTITLLLSAVTTKAQLGGLIKKAKDKVTQKKEAAAQTTNNPAIQTENNIPNEGNNQLNNNPTEYEGYVNRGWYNAGSINSDSKKEPLKEPYSILRVKNEKGTFHFAKDYAEIKPYLKPIDNNLKFVFSTTPFTTGQPNITNSFTSHDHIYAQMQTSGTIKDALKIQEKDDGVNIGFKVFYEDYISEKMWPLPYALSTTQINGQNLTVDIMPDISVYKANKNGVLYASTFPNLNDQITFPKSGTYKIGVFVSNQNVDDWGKSIYGDNITYAGFFDYTFTPADAATIIKEGNAVNNILRNREKFSDIKPMHKGWTLQSSTPMAGYSIAKYNQDYLRFYPNVKIIKTYIAPDDGWSVIKDNDNFLPLYKYSSQWVTYFCKTNDGKCYYHTCNLRQKYEGGGTYGAKFLAVFDSEINYVDCGSMK